MAYKGALCNGKVLHREAQGCEEPGEPCAAPELATRERGVLAAEEDSIGCCAAAASVPLQLHDCDNLSHVAEALTRGGSLVETPEGASQGCLTEAAQDAARPRDTDRAPRSVHFADEPELCACDEQEMGHSSVGNPPEAANLFELRTCRCGSALDQGEGPATPPLSAAADPSPTRADGSVHFADQPELMDCGEPELEDIADHEQALSPLPPEELSERQRDAVAGGEQSPDVGAGENFLAQLQAAKALLREGDQSAEDGHLTMAVGVYTQVLGMGLCEDLARDVHFKRAVALERLEILRGDTGLYLNAYDDYSRSIVRGRARHAVRYLHRGRLSVMQCQQLHFPNVLDEDVLCRRLRRAEEDFEAALRLDSTGSLGVRQRAQAELDKLEEIAHFTTKRQMREEEREKLEHEEWDRKRRERVLLKSLGLEPDRHGESASPGDEDLCECGGPIRYGINDEGMDTAVCRDCGVEQHHCYRIDRTDVGGELNDDQCGDPGRVGRHCEELSSSAGPAPMDLRPLSTSARTCVDDNLHCRKAGPKPEDLRPENRRDADRQVQFETNKVRLRQVAKSIPVADEVVQHVEMLFDALDTPLEYKCAECPGHIERFKAELKELNEEERGLQSQPDREAESSDHDETGDDEGKQLRAFRAMDKDGSGFIISEDLRDFLEGEGVAREELGEITDAEVDEMIRGADVGPDGRISYEKFVKMMLRVKFERKEQDFRYRLREAEYRISAKDEITSSAEGLVHLECGHCLCPPCHARIEANLREKKAAVKAAESMEEKENAKAEQDEAEKCPARECAEKFVKRTPPREKDGGRQAQIAAIIYVAGRWAGKRYSRLLCEIVKSCNVGVEQLYHGDHAGRQLAPLKRATAGRTNLRGLDKKMFRIRDTRDELLAACGRWAESAGLSLDAQKACLKALRQNATAIKLGTNRRDGPLLIAAVIVLARSVMSEEEAADAAKDFCARLERHLKVELPDPAAIAAKAEELKQTPEFQRVVPEWRRVSQPKKATPLDTIRPLDPKRKQARKAESAKLHRKTMQRVRNAKSPGQLRAVARGVGIAEDAIQSVSGKKEMMMQQLKKLIEREMRVQEKFEAENGLCPSDDPFCAPARNKPGRESKGSTRSCSTATPPRGSDHDDSPVPKVDFTRKDLDDPQRVVKRLEAAIAAKRRARARPAARVDLFDDQHDDQQRSTQRGSSRSRSRYSPYGT